MTINLGIVMPHTNNTSVKMMDHIYDHGPISLHCLLTS
jgi:hypothetical protein